MTEWPMLKRQSHHQGGGLRYKVGPSWMKIYFSSTWTGSNMPQGMLTGVPAGGSISGIGGWGHGVEEREGWGAGVSVFPVRE